MYRLANGGLNTLNPIEPSGISFMRSTQSPSMRVYPSPSTVSSTYGDSSRAVDSASSLMREALDIISCSISDASSFFLMTFLTTACSTSDVTMWTLTSWVCPKRWHLLTAW